MQQASKKFDETIQIINRIKNPKKKKYQPHSQPDYYHTYELPTITNTLRNFHKQEYIPSHNPNTNTKKIQTELDNIINGALQSYKNQKINKIIFATPLSSRLALGKTYYHSSQASPTEQEPLSYRSLDKDCTPKRRPKQNLNLRSLKLMKESQQLAKFNTTINVNQFLDIVGQNKMAEQFDMFYTTPEEPKPLRAKKVRKPFVVREKRKGEEGVRYSPWKNQEEEDTLL